MGRAKVRMELIKSEKARQATLKSRKTGLKKKIQELSTLCDVKICMIMYEPVKDGRPVDPEIWPANPNAIHELFNRYTAQSDDDRSKKTANLLSFFNDRNEKLEMTLMKLRKKNREAKYPTWDERYNDLSEEQLRKFARMLETKIEASKPRLEFLKNCQILESSSNCYSTVYDTSFCPLTQPHSEVKLVGLNDQTGEVGADMNGNYTMTTLMNNGETYYELDGMHSSNFMYMPMQPLNEPMYSDNMPPGLLDYLMVNNPIDAGPDFNYGLTMQQQMPMPHYGQCWTIKEEGYNQGIFRS